MKLDKAIQLGKDAAHSLKGSKFYDHADAVQLGIEALKTIRLWRFERGSNPDLTLPGETDDDSPS